MVFSSLLFIFRFLPAFLMLYTLSPEKYQNLVLFLGSLIFCAWGAPVYIGIMLFSTFLDYGNGRLLEYAFCNGKTYMARAVLTESVLVNLSLLGIFKYAGIFPLPIGISFYTFQTLSYTIDVDRGSLGPERDFLNFALFVSFFPQLVAGPIEKASNLLPQLKEEHRFTYENASWGAKLMAWGFYKKMVVAD